MRKFRRICLFFAAVLAAVLMVLLLVRDRETDFHAKYDGTDLSADISSIGKENTYASYLASCGTDRIPSETVRIDIADFSGDAVMTEDGVYCADGSSVTWAAEAEEGLYEIRVSYTTVESRGVDPVRELRINGALPFDGAAMLSLSRLWTDGGEARTDDRGNEIRPAQVERFARQTVYLKDDMGYEAEPYRFCFHEGSNTVTLTAVSEPVIVNGIELVPASARQDYRAYRERQPETSMSETGENYLQIVQGEDASLHSSPALYAAYDRSSPLTVPYSVTNTVLNYIGGDAWNAPGQWLEWKFSVPEDGYYRVSVKARQMYQRGSLSCRGFMIDGEVPFSELESVAFNYDTEWSMVTLSGGNGEPFEFYLTEGEHTLRMEATLGQMGGALRDLEDSIYRLNLIYRRILVLTGVDPDPLRDYDIKGIYPEIIEAMDLESKRLYKLVDDFVAVTGQKNDRIAVAQTMAIQLEDFVRKPSRITRDLNAFKDNISALGSALQNMSETKLDVDLIVISGGKAEVPAVKSNFFKKLMHEVRSCVSSYTVDYNSLGNVYEDGEGRVIDVWIVAGRDQSTILKTMIDDTFTPASGIGVNVKLVSSDAILKAVVSGIGPDVVLSVGSSMPVDYAMRSAAEDLTQFGDFDEVASQFRESAVTPFRYDGGVYALPETQTFSLLFYRSDILEELNLAIPETWTDIIDILPTLQGNNMTIGIHYPEITSPDLSVFDSLVYQNGGTIYDPDGKRTMIDNDAGVAAFRFYTELYNDYGLPTGFDFVSRFRSGEMPIGITSYTAYNTLMVSAPEIRGLWDFTLFPGTVLEDGSISHLTQSSGVCCMMLSSNDEQAKASSWEFMKWWTGTETQVRFGREMESILGASARYATANTGAIRQLAWSARQLDVLETQMAETFGFPEIAGGYSTTRHITNAIRKVINEKRDAREVLASYSKTINEEIKIKRQEFNLPID